MKRTNGFVFTFNQIVKLKMSLVILILFIFVCASGYKYEIGFIERENYPIDGRELAIMQDYLEKKLKSIGNGNNNITIKTCKYETNVQAIGKCINDLDKEGIRHIYGYCTDEYYTDSIKQLLEEKNILIWCVNTYNFGSCEKHFVMGVSLIKVIEKCI